VDRNKASSEKPSIPFGEASSKKALRQIVRGHDYAKIPCFENLSFL
jgi:hypothetical protein